jgi:colicin import membrane protein
MSSAALRHDTLLPRSPGGNGAGAALSLLAHAGLLLALTTAVDWRARTPETVSAELWASVPQAAAPRAESAPEPTPAPAPQPTPAPAPAPAPPAPRVQPPAAEPDIAVERERRRRAEAEARKAAQAEAQKAAEAKRQQAELERRQAEAEARRQADEDKRRAAAEKQRQEQAAQTAEEARLAKQRQENLERIMGQAGSATGSGTAARSAAPSAAYAGRLVAEIRRHVFFDTATLPDNAVPEVEVRTAPGGTILSRRLVKSSGHKEWDEAVLRAIDRISTLPRDVDGRVPPVILVAFRPRDA